MYNVHTLHKGQYRPRKWEYLNFLWLLCFLSKPFSPAAHILGSPFFHRRRPRPLSPFPHRLFSYVPHILGGGEGQYSSVGSVCKTWGGRGDSFWVTSADQGVANRPPPPPRPHPTPPKHIPQGFIFRLILRGRNNQVIGDRKMGLDV